MTATVHIAKAATQTLQRKRKSDPMAVTIIIILIIVVIAFVSFKSYGKKLESGCCGGGDSKSVKRDRVRDRNKANYPYKATITIDGMVCANCSKHIENELNKIDGIWARIDIASKTGEILSKAEINEQLIRNCVNNLGGYTVLEFKRS